MIGIDLIKISNINKEGLAVITLRIENEKIENIFLNEFHSNKEKFFEFIQNSYDKMKTTTKQDNSNIDLIKSQETSMSQTWDNDEDKAWDEL
jgi:LPS O-antigen subunit length determinant protein (WzzB/FepE family)